ncbi:MAG TPA: L-glutamate gamma-semialdehyde dehydrogenase [Bryobacteraceae bacterium]|nr:L-glutamate gamma-semialdehyde dehydrogenase [Bryobacteraceae bacterium]
MSTTVAEPVQSLPAFANEHVADFSQPRNREAMEKALRDVRAQFGQDHDLLIAGRREKTADKLKSLNPSRPGEVVGIHSKATAEMAREAVESAHAYFPEWAASPAAVRVDMLLRASALIRKRRFEFDAWLVYEAGKTWPEADADICEAIDFCEYYARQMMRMAKPDPVVQMPGEKDEMIYLPLGVGIIVPPWNFPLAIMTGMTTAALVAGNTVIIKPSSDTPTIAAKFAEVLLEAGFPPKSFSLLVGSGAVIGDLLVEHPKTRFIAFTGSRDVGLRINELAAKPRKGQVWIKRVLAEMGGKDAIVVDREADLDSAAKGVVWSAFGYQGQKCSACSRAIVDQAVYDEFLDKVKAEVSKLTVGPSDEQHNYMGPVINEGAKKSILDYVEVGKKEGRLIAGGSAGPGDGYFIQPTVIADIDSTSRLFQEEIFGPVLAVTKARDYDDALRLANDSEYGLTGAVFTKNPEKIRKARDQFFVGNLYINRKCTGAMVGAHPFGGFNMSGTDSKAGGPDYLLQFLQAKSIAEKIS